MRTEAQYPQHRGSLARAWNAGWLPTLAAVGLTYVFWQPLWHGSGFIGGDLYSYYFPQKQFLADCLRAGIWPLWNPLTGHGYPVLGESQTGACYPLHVLAYFCWDLQTAWNLVFLTHYVLAFGMMWLCARRSGLNQAGALLAATVYVYGWFPVRSCLEWAILGGVYLPGTIWCIEGFLQTGLSRFLWGLALMLGLQLMGGHYQLAFYTWLLGLVYVPLRIWFVDQLADGAANVQNLLPSDDPERVWRSGFLVAAAAGGIALGSLTLFPTVELQRLSQRQGPSRDHDPNYGAIPPAYLSQLMTPWYWYDPTRNLDEELNRLRWGALPSGTNRVEAHLYFGQLPFYLVTVGLVVLAVRRRWNRWILSWVVIVGVSLLIAVGWLQPVLVHLPGFNFFRGVGRIGVLATCGCALLAGHMLDRLLARLPSLSRTLLAAGVIGVTVVDLAWWPPAVNYAVIVDSPPIRLREQSPLRAVLRDESPQPVRLYAPGANLANLLGVSCTPPYLGLGPRAYFDPQFTLPAAVDDDFHTYSLERYEWLKRAGVTHILCFEPLEPRGWPVQLVWQGFDLLLNPAWARFTEPLYLYRLLDAPGRVTWDNDQTGGIGRVTVTPHQVTIEAATPSPRLLVLKDLAYPGWQVAVDGQTVTGVTVGMFRGVQIPPGQHTVVWSYRPSSVYWGALGSGLGVVWLGLLTASWRRHAISSTRRPPTAVPSGIAAGK